MNGFPIGYGVLSGYLGILQDVFIIFLQHVDMPGFSIAEANHHAGTLLGIVVARSQLCQLRIVLQICSNGKVIVCGFAQNLTISLFFIQHAIVLLIQNPAISVKNLEEFIFQNQFCVEILIQTNTSAYRCIALLFCLQGVVALRKIRQLEIAISIYLQGLFTLGAHIAQHKILLGIFVEVIQNNLTAEGLVAFGNRLCLGRYDRTVLRTVDGQCNTSVLIEGNISNLLLPIEHHRGQCIACIGHNGDHCLHTGDDAGGTGNGIMLALLQHQRHAAHHTMTVKLEIA